jgi:hypothetical protein
MFVLEVLSNFILQIKNFQMKSLNFFLKISITFPADIVSFWNYSRKFSQKKKNATLIKFNVALKTNQYAINVSQIENIYRRY